MNSWWEAVFYCGVQDKVGNVLTQANLHQNQQIVGGFGVFVGRNETSNLAVRICFSTGMAKNSKKPAKSSCAEIIQPLIKTSPVSRRAEDSILQFALV